MNNSRNVLPFALDRQRYALFLSSVGRVYRTVEVTPLPKAPPIILGIINVRGGIIPVVDMRKRFGLPEREIAPNVQMIIAQTPRQNVALMADGVNAVIDIDEREIIRPDRVLPKVAQDIAKGVHLNYDEYNKQVNEAVRLKRCTS